MKSKWAYNNGKRELSRVLDAAKAPINGWLEHKGVLFYAERNKYDETALIIKTYANRKQANAAVEKLKAQGIDCYMYDVFPFRIAKTA